MRSMKTEPCRHCNGTGREMDQRAMGADLRKKREAKKRSLRSVADDMGISYPYLSDLELGRRMWSTELISKFERAIQ